MGELMPALYRSLIAAIFVLWSGFSFAEEKPFFDAPSEGALTRYEASLQKSVKPLDSNPQDAVQEAWQALRAGDPGRAAALAAAVVVTAPKNATAWLRLARALAAINPKKSYERYDLRSNAIAAAYAAYQRGKSPRQRAMALVEMSQLFETRSRWRPAINALKVSLDLFEQPAIRAAYKALRAQHGFRILDYSVDSDARSPRLCVQFSEELGRGKIDFAKFFSLDGRDPASVSVEQRQICIEGLRHGRRYETTVRSGLPSAIGEVLLKSARLVTYVRDRSPSVRTSGRSYVLPSTGQQGVPLISVNTDKLAVEVYRIGDRSLARSVIDGDLQRQYSGYQVQNLRENLGARVWKGELEVARKLNEDVTTAFPVSDAIPELKPGVYVLLADAVGSKSRDWDTKATQWFIVSDLGLIAFSGGDGVHAFVRSLRTATPRPNLKVRLVARNNEVLAGATTDARGYARFAAGVTRGEGGMAPALLVAESGDGDYAFLDLTENAFDLTDRGVGGREVSGPLDAYTFTERGIYRPGATVHITTLARDNKARAARGVPLTLAISRPDGVEHRRTTLRDGGNGGRVYDFALAASAMTGTWRARVYGDPKADPIGEVSFLVEDFVPERLEMDLKPVSKVLVPGKGGEIELTGRYLYGAPAADLAVEGEVVVRQRSGGIAGLDGYRFGLEDEQVIPVRSELGNLPQTDEKGIASLAIALPGLPRTSRLLEAGITVRLREPGGRTIERRTTLDIAPAQPLIGIKPAFDDDTIGRGETAEFDIVMLDRAGKTVAAKNLKWEVLRVERHYQWYSRSGSWGYEPITYTRRVADGVTATRPGAPGHVGVPLKWGRYRIEVTTDDPAGPATSIGFDAGWYVASSADSPEALQMALDKDRYRPGDTAKVTIETDEPGKALVAVLNDGLAMMREVDVPAGGTTVDLKVEQSWGSGAYATVMFYRAMNIKARQMPGRSIGLEWIEIDQSDRTLAISLDLPEKVGSASTLDIPVKLAGLAPGETAHMVVAAVDVGILNLTRFEAPAPEKWFYAQRRLGTEIRDLYGRLIDGMRAARGRLRSGGDGAGDAPVGSPPVEKPVSLFSGLVTVGEDGTAEVSFDLPEFNGTLRVMAVAWTADKVGHASKEVIVRDPIALLVTGPRFLTMGDQTRVLVDMHNVEGVAGSYRLNVVAESGDSGAETPSRIVDERDVAFETGQRKLVRATFRAREIGRTVIAVRVTGPGGINVGRRIALEVKPPAPSVRRQSVRQLAANGGSIRISSDIFGDLIAARSKVSVTAGPAAALDVPGLLVSLDRYPYGCAEQTTSKALPLLYLDMVASRARIATGDDLHARVQKAVDRLFEFQGGSGGFGLWSPGNGGAWLTAYVGDFLTRAREEGYKVPRQAFEQALDRMQNTVNFAADFKKGGEGLAYALYVLARNGRAPIGDLRYYVDTRLDRFATPVAQAQLGAALAMYGDKARARRAFGAALAMLEANTRLDLRSDFGSTLRDGAATLTLVAESGVRPETVPTLADLVSRALAQKTYTSTQENAWMLLAARSLMKRVEGVKLSVNGKLETGTVMRGLSADDLARAPMVIRNDGAYPVKAVVTVTGEAMTPEPAANHGFRLERTYYTLDGKQAEIASATGGSGTVRQNTRFVVVLKIEPSEVKRGGRLLLVDRLPAGFEIENPHIVDSAGLANLDWLKTTVDPEHTEFRDDRFVAAFDLNHRSGNAVQGFSVAYIVRAVSPGHFVHPPATIEDMYRPERFARTSSGTLIVEAAAN